MVIVAGVAAAVRAAAVAVTMADVGVNVAVTGDDDAAAEGLQGRRQRWRAGGGRCRAPEAPARRTGGGYAAGRYRQSAGVEWDSTWRALCHAHRRHHSPLHGALHPLFELPPGFGLEYEARALSSLRPLATCFLPRFRSSRIVYLVFSFPPPSRLSFPPGPRPSFSGSYDDEVHGAISLKRTACRPLSRASRTTRTSCAFAKRTNEICSRAGVYERSRGKRSRNRFQDRTRTPPTTTVALQTSRRRFLTLLLSRTITALERYHCTL